MAEVDHELEVLLSLHGYEFDFARGYRVRFAARRISRQRAGHTASNTA